MMYPSEWRLKIAGQIAHLSINRTITGEKQLSGLEWLQMYMSIEDHLVYFIKHLVQPYLSNWDRAGLLKAFPRVTFD
jgi:hypothetical protein